MVENPFFHPMAEVEIYSARFTSSDVPLEQLWREENWPVEIRPCDGCGRMMVAVYDPLWPVVSYPTAHCLDCYLDKLDGSDLYPE